MSARPGRVALAALTVLATAACSAGGANETDPSTAPGAVEQASEECPVEFRGADPAAAHDGYGFSVAWPDRVDDPRFREALGRCSSGAAVLYEPGWHGVGRKGEVRLHMPPRWIKVGPEPLCLIRGDQGPDRIAYVRMPCAPLERLWKASGGVQHGTPEEEAIEESNEAGWEG